MDLRKYTENTILPPHTFCYWTFWNDNTLKIYHILRIQHLHSWILTASPAHFIDCRQIVSLSHQSWKPLYSQVQCMLIVSQFISGSSSSDDYLRVQHVLELITFRIMILSIIIRGKFINCYRKLREWNSLMAYSIYSQNNYGG